MSCGIYQILNTVTGKCYVGSSIGIETQRWPKHKYLLCRNSHDSPKLQHSWNKHGTEVWEWNILQECSESSLDWHEAFWMAKLDSIDNGYNCTRLLLEDGKIYRRMTKETKAKISKTNTGRKHTDESKKKIRGSLLGVKHSIERNKKMSGIRKGCINIGKKRNKETIEKIREAHIGSKRSEETKRKMSESGKKKVFSEEHRANLSKAQSNRSEETRKRQSQSTKGKPKSETAKAKMREAWVRRKARKASKAS